MTEVEKQSLIDELEDIETQGDEILAEIEREKQRVNTTNDLKVIDHVAERLEELYKELKLNNKRLTTIVKKLKKAK